jgi:hypothetical protein
MPIHPPTQDKKASPSFNKTKEMAYINARTPPNWARRSLLRPIPLSGLGTIDQVMATISKTESSKPGLNNPGNLIYVGQPNASPSSNCFTDTNTGAQDCIAQFSSLDAGVQAEQALIQNLAASGLTISQFTARYAPAGSGNNPAAYAQSIAAATGLSVDDPLSAAIAAADSSASPFIPYGPPLPPDFTVSPGDSAGTGTDLMASLGLGSGVSLGVVGLVAIGVVALALVSRR